MNNDFYVDFNGELNEIYIFYSVFPFACIVNGYTRPVLATCDCALSTVNVKCCVYKSAVQLVQYE